MLISTSRLARIRLISRIASSECPPSSKKLSSIPTRSTPRTSANSPHRISSCGVRGARQPLPRRKLRRRQRATVELAVRRQRQTIQNHQRRRHHVVRQPQPKMRPQRRSIDRRPRRRHHIANQPLAPSRILARNHRALGNPSLPQQRRLDLARLNAEPAQLDLPRPPGPQTPEPRPPASAPSPRCGTSGSPQHHTDRQQTAPTSDPRDPDSPAPDPLPICKAPQQPHRNRLQATIQNINPSVPRSDDQSARAEPRHIVRQRPDG